MIKTAPITHDIKPLIPVAARYLKRRKDVRFAYLFGGYARGNPTSFSDVDIAVYLEGDEHSEKRLDILGTLIDIFKTDEIDLVILNTAPLALAMKILQNKRLLADNAPYARHSFESLTMRSYFDFSKLENRILEQRYLNGR